ncbi:MAG TPA: ATP-binding protein, partial [Bacteroidota bacterium]|nr:ATP-binding protein [Bacteroidota bacterium]
STVIGHAPEELVGASAYDLLHPDDRTAVTSALSAIQGTTPVTTSYRIRRKDGTYAWFETICRAVQDRETGNVTEVHCASRDIAERMRAREREKADELRLFQAAKLASLGTLVSGIAHEIHNPNNYIRLNSQTLKKFWGDIRSVLSDAAAKPGGLMLHSVPYDEARTMIEELLAGIEEGSARIEKLLLNLRDFARGDVGDLNEPVDLNQVVRSAITLVQNLIQKSTDVFSVRESAKLPTVKGNYHQLEQVVINLLTNACQALGSRDKAITVTTDVEQDGGSIVLTVEDQGVGIPSENIPRLVDPFFTTKRQHGGSGLGLAVSYRIVQNHGGTMSFTSKVGKGTVVTVRLPSERSAQ